MKTLKKNRHLKISEVHNLDSKLELHVKNKKLYEKIEKKNRFEQTNSVLQKNPRFTTEIQSWNYLPYSGEIGVQTLA